MQKLLHFSRLELIRHICIAWLFARNVYSFVHEGPQYAIAGNTAHFTCSCIHAERLG